MINSSMRLFKPELELRVHPAIAYVLTQDAEFITAHDSVLIKGTVARHMETLQKTHNKRMEEQGLTPKSLSHHPLELIIESIAYSGTVSSSLGDARNISLLSWYSERWDKLSTELNSELNLRSPNEIDTVISELNLSDNNPLQLAVLIHKMPASHTPSQR